MKITALSENTTCREDVLCEHGLSLHIALKNESILFDTGASNNFLINAQTMGISLEEVDYAILSHGHNDHGGGLAHFLALNQKAVVFAHYKAFDDYFVKREQYHPIGLDGSLSNHPQVKLVEKEYQGDHFSIFSDVKWETMRPTANSTLFMQVGDGHTQDRFEHEQNLILTEDGTSVLVCGCAHNGIVNILEEYKKRNNSYPDAVIGGFHLYNPTTKQDEAPEVVDAIADYLLKTKAKFFTCHCTGENSYMRLKAKMGDKIDYLRSGNQIVL